MSKGSKTKKDKVPKITEEEYERYLSTLKGEPLTEKKTLEEKSCNATQPTMQA